MVDFKVHIVCGDHTRKRKLFETTQNPYKTSFNGYILNTPRSLENPYDFSFNFKTVFLKMLIESFLH